MMVARKLTDHGPRLEPGDEGHIEVLAELTPDFAKGLLDTLHPDQRKIRQYHVDFLAAAMREGRWRWTSETIKLDRNMRVIDGQHRLSAVVQSGVTLKNVLVAVVTDDDAIKSIDQGIRRSLNDMLATHGKDAIHRTITGAILAEHFHWSAARKRMPHEKQLQILESFPLMVEAQELYRMGPKRGSIVTVGPLSAAIACMRKNRDAAFEFFRHVFAMNPILYGEPNDIVRLLYTYLQQRPRLGVPSTNEVIFEQAYKSIRAWNAWRSCERITKLQYGSGSDMLEPMP